MLLSIGWQLDPDQKSWDADGALVQSSVLINVTTRDLVLLSPSEFCQRILEPVVTCLINDVASVQEGAGAIRIFRNGSEDERLMKALFTQ